MSEPRARWMSTVGHTGCTHIDCPGCGAELCDEGHEEICECRGSGAHFDHEVFYCPDCRDTFTRGDEEATR